MPVKRRPEYIAVCDSPGCTTNSLEIEADTKQEAELRLWEDNWMVAGDKVTCPKCQRRPRVLKTSAIPKELAFLDAPPQASKEETSQAELRERLEEARDDWASRTYVQNTDWTETNEERRARQVETMESLMGTYDRFNRWTPKQEELVERLIKNTFK